MKLVIIESPFASELPDGVARNLRYLRAAMRDCLKRGEAPYASHGLYTQPGVLDDGVPEDREEGIQAGFAWRRVAQATIIYTDLGISTGMKYGIKAAEALKDWSASHDIEYRTLGPDWENVAIQLEYNQITKWPRSND